MIFKCGEDDLDAMTEFYGKVTDYLVKHVNYPKWTPGEYPGRESARLAIAADAQYAYEDAGRIIGAFVLNNDPQGDYSAGDWSAELKEGEYLVIHALAVDCEMYNRGIGKKMVQYCIETAREKGYKALRLDVVPDNYPARRMYESMGFVFAGEYDLKRGMEEIPVFALYGMDFI